MPFDPRPTLMGEPLSKRIGAALRGFETGENGHERAIYGIKHEPAAGY